MNAELIRAIDLALDGSGTPPTPSCSRTIPTAPASWIHAVLHKIEGDSSNSLYWYRRAGKTELADHEPTAELRMIRAEIGGG